MQIMETLRSEDMFSHDVAHIVQGMCVLCTSSSIRIGVLCHRMVAGNTVHIWLNTPQSLYNTIVGVHSINRVS